MKESLSDEQIQQLKQRSLTEWKAHVRENERKSSRIVRLWKPMVVSVAALCILALGVLLVFQLPNTGPGSSDSKIAAILSDSHQLEFIEHETLPGQRKRITLSDGSIITLSHASRIRYPKHFEEHERVLTLQGHAFFEVESDSLRPFIVHTDQFSVEVLGTSFDVQSYEGEDYHDVTVAAGKVRVAGMTDALADNEWYLTPSQRVRYHVQNAEAELLSVDLEESLSWMQGRLALRDRTLGEIARHIERWYGVEMEIQGRGLGQRKFTLVLENEPLERVLRMMAIAGGFEYTLTENSRDESEKGAYHVLIR